MNFTLGVGREHNIQRWTTGKRFSNEVLSHVENKRIFLVFIFTGLYLMFWP